MPESKNQGKNSSAVLFPRREEQESLLPVASSTLQVECHQQLQELQRRGVRQVPGLGGEQAEIAYASRVRHQAKDEQFECVLLELFGEAGNRSAFVTFDEGELQ